VARKRAALMSLNSGTNAPGSGIREMEVPGVVAVVVEFVFVIAVLLRRGLVGVLTALTERTATL
jgi:hypothetical protein